MYSSDRCTDSEYSCVYCVMEAKHYCYRKEIEEKCKQMGVNVHIWLQPDFADVFNSNRTQYLIEFLCNMLKYQDWRVASNEFSRCFAHYLAICDACARMSEAVTIFECNPSGDNSDAYNFISQQIPNNDCTIVKNGCCNTAIYTLSSLGMREFQKLYQETSAQEITELLIRVNEKFNNV